jgi:hypothetical protein
LQARVSGKVLPTLRLKWGSSILAELAVCRVRPNLRYSPDGGRAKVRLEVFECSGQGQGIKHKDDAMSRVVAIQGTNGVREIDYSMLSTKEIEKKIKAHEKKYGSFAKFMRQYDCESSSPEDYLTLIDWECLLNEWKDRRGKRLSLVKSDKNKPR